MDWMKKFMERMIETGKRGEYVAPGQTAQPEETRFEMPPQQRAAMLKGQAQTFFRINGQSFVRVAYGEEQTGRAHDAAAEMKRCPGCGAKPGECHIPSCTLEQCPACGGIAFQCECEYGK